MENWPWPRVSLTGSSRPTKLLSTSGTHSSNAFWRKIRFHLTNCSVWLPPLSRLLLGFHYGIDKRVSYKTCSNCGFISVHILTLSLCTFINPDRPSLVTIEAVCDSKIYYLPYSTAEEFFTTNAETMQIKCTLVEQSYLLMYHRLLDMYCKTTEELYLDLLNRCPDIQEHITLKEVASFLQVTPETISRIRHKLNKCIRCKLEK